VVGAFVMPSAGLTPRGIHVSRRRHAASSIHHRPAAPEAVIVIVIVMAAAWLAPRGMETTAVLKLLGGAGLTGSAVVAGLRRVRRSRLTPPVV
jgi:hypothetical protein